LAESLYAIAQKYSPPRKFKEAESVYKQLIQLFPDSPHAVEALFRAPKIHIFYLIQSGNYTEAQAAIDRFTADFAKHPALPGIVYWFAKEFEAAKRYDKAKGTYQQVVWQYPKSSHADKALLSVPKMDVLSSIESGNDTAAQEALDTLIADFNDHPGLPEAVFVIGEKYYNKAFQCGNERSAEAKDSFQKALAVWKQIIEELPKLNSTVTAHAYHFSAECYRRMRQYSKAVEYYQIVVDNWPDYKDAWWAQYNIGRCYQEMMVDGTISESEADEKTRPAFRQLLERYPDCQRAQDVKEWLARHGSAGL